MWSLNVIYAQWSTGEAAIVLKRNGKLSVGCCSKVVVLTHVFSKEPCDTDPQVVIGYAQHGES